MSRFYDLASLAKPLVTAPLALAFLDLDADRRWSLGFPDRPEPLTVRQLLSHSSGLPPWRPYTGEALAPQLRRPVPEHPLLRAATPGLASYSDLNYRLLSELLEAETGVPFLRLGAASGLSPAPWTETPHRGSRRPGRRGLDPRHGHGPAPARPAPAPRCQRPGRHARPRGLRHHGPPAARRSRPSIHRRHAA